MPGMLLLLGNVVDIQNTTRSQSYREVGVRR
jgi:hypothetical protein